MALTLCLYFTALDAWNGTAHLIIIHPGTPLQFPAQLHATQQMTQYLTTRQCRWQFLLSAFGFSKEANLSCGHCNNTANSGRMKDLNCCKSADHYYKIGEYRQFGVALAIRSTPIPLQTLCRLLGHNPLL